MKTNERVEVIDLLRGLSCLAVVLYHVRVDLWIGWWRITSYPHEYSSFAKAMAWLSVPTPFLGYAILLFFLISGFCIHYPNTTPESKPYWKTYFFRRFWRIYPTYLVAIVLTSIISYFCHIKWADQTWDPYKILRVATISQNYPPENGQFLSNPSLWTIPLEIEFYALYPLAYCLFQKLRNFSLILAVSLICSGFSVALSKNGFSWLSYTALFLWPSWLLGAWVASIYTQKRFKSINLIALSVGLTIFLTLSLWSRLKSWESWMQYGLWTGFYLLLFIIFLKGNEHFYKIKDLIAVKSLTWLGKISFSLYLIHFPCLKLFGYFHLVIFREKPANFLIPLLYLIPVIFAAWIFFKYVESPIHHWSKNRSKH